MFRFVLTNSITRKKMLDFLRPILCSPHSDIGYNNGINWTEGVYDDKEDIFITLIYYVPDGLAHCGMDFYKYIVIVGGNIVFSVTDDWNCNTVSSEFSIPDEYQEFSEIIKEGIKIYSDFNQRRLFKKSLEETGEISDYYSYCRNIEEQMYSQIIQ